MNITYKSFLWVTPFIAFLLGYQALKWVLDVNFVETPKIMGLSINDAIKQLSSYQLNARILSEKEDPTVEEGRVIYQSPNPGIKIKPNQSVFLVITRKPPKTLTPNFVGQTLDEIKKLAKEKSIRLKIHALEGAQPENTVITQSPLADKPMDNDEVTVYISLGETKFRIFPNLYGLKLSEVDPLFEKYKIKPEVKHTKEIPHDCSLCTIVEHFPASGSVIDVDKFDLASITLEPQELPAA